MYSGNKRSKRKRDPRLLKMIATFSITKVNLCFLSQTMISIAHFEITRNGEKTKIFSQESSVCPICGGPLKVHGTCIRKVRQGEHTHQIHLRVMECRHCGKTHRELPEGLVPYKRHDLNSLCEVLRPQQTQTTCETQLGCCIRFWPCMVSLVCPKRSGRVDYGGPDDGDI